MEKSKSVFGKERRKEVTPTCGVDAEWRQLHKLAFVCERACGLWWRVRLQPMARLQPMVRLRQ